MKDLKELAKEAYAVQNACNLSGVVHSMAAAMSDLWEIARSENKGTDWVNNHPITRAYVSKLVSLAACEEIGTQIEALHIVNELSTRA